MVRHRRSSEHVCRSGCRSVDASVMRTVSRRLRSVRMAGCWRTIRVEALAVVLVRKDGKRRPTKVEMGRMIERVWPRTGVGREN